MDAPPASFRGGQPMADPTVKTGNDVVVTPQQQQQQQLLDQLDAILNDPSTHILIQRPPPNPFAGGAPRYPKPHTVTTRPTSPWGPVVTEPAPIPPRVQ